jgi:hypothetical protein
MQEHRPKKPWAIPIGQAGNEPARRPALSVNAYHF